MNDFQITVPMDKQLEPATEATRYLLESKCELKDKLNELKEMYSSEDICIATFFAQRAAFIGVWETLKEFAEDPGNDVSKLAINTSCLTWRQG